MDHLKDYNCEQMNIITVTYETQILAGSCEHSLSWLIDEELDLSTDKKLSCYLNINRL